MKPQRTQRNKHILINKKQTAYISGCFLCGLELVSQQAKQNLIERLEITEGRQQ